MSRKVYVVADVCFVPSADVKGMWLKTNRCVAFVECPECGAAVGEMCRGSKGPVRYTHYARRRLYRGLKKKVVDKTRRTTIVMEMEE